MTIRDQCLAFLPGDWVQSADQNRLSSVLRSHPEGSAILEKLQPRVGERFRVIGYRRPPGGGVLYELGGIGGPFGEECLLASTYEKGSVNSKIVFPSSDVVGRWWNTTILLTDPFVIVPAHRGSR